MAPLLPAAEWFASLPTAYIGASALITDPDGRVLLVDPNYRDHWRLPGGAAEHAEAPHTACEREVPEEVGLQLAAGPLLAVQGTAPRGERPKPFCSLVFDCGTVAADTRLALQDSELDSAEFLHPDTAVARMHPALAPRLAAALEARRTGRTGYVTG